MFSINVISNIYLSRACQNTDLYWCYTIVFQWQLAIVHVLLFITGSALLVDSCMPDKELVLRYGDRIIRNYDMPKRYEDLWEGKLRILHIACIPVIQHAAINFVLCTQVHNIENDNFQHILGLQSRISFVFIPVLFGVAYGIFAICGGIFIRYLQRPVRFKILEPIIWHAAFLMLRYWITMSMQHFADIMEHYRFHFYG